MLDLLKKQVMFDCTQINGVSLDHQHHHHIRCIDHVPPLSQGPRLLVLMSDKNVLGSRSMREDNVHRENMCFKHLFTFILQFS